MAISSEETQVTKIRTMLFDGLPKPPGDITAAMLILLSQAEPDDDFKRDGFPPEWVEYFGGLDQDLRQKLIERTKDTLPKH